MADAGGGATKGDVARGAIYEATLIAENNNKNAGAGTFNFTSYMYLI